MSPRSRSFVKTALAIPGLMALVTATMWITLFILVRPTRGETVDARKVYVIDGDTVAIARERIRVLGKRSRDPRGSL